MTTEVANRIRGLVVKSGLSMRELSRRMRLNPVSLSQWVKGKYEPNKDAVAVLAEYFGVSPAYIQYGEGEAPNEETFSPDTISIPLYNVSASCGGGAFVENEAVLRNIRVTKDFLRRYAPSANPKALNIISVSGDSMSPTMEDGDAVIVDTSDTEVKRDGLYAIQMNGSLFVKRLQVMPNGVRIISDNPLYPPIDMGEQDSLFVIGKCYAGAQLRALL